jgi:hypothetical protein
MFHNLYVTTFSILTPRLLVLIPSWRNWTISLLDDVFSFSLSAFILSCSVSPTHIEHQSINRDITDLNTCKYTFSGLNRCKYTFTGLNRCKYTFTGSNRCKYTFTGSNRCEYIFSANRPI